MEIAKVFKNGRSQAVRIPRKYRFSTDEVRIQKRGDQLILTPVTSEMTLDKFLAMPPIPGFELDRTAGLKEQERELF